MSEQPIDLSALDPARDADRFESALAHIHRDALTARHAARETAVGAGFGSSLATLSIPALVAAALVLAVSLSALVRLPRGGTPSTRAASAPEVLGIPPRLVALMRTPSRVSLADLNDALRVGQ